ncbi:Adenylyltransferase thiF [Anaplasma phagocytophilum]|uniref:Adenylyltransferase thiF n=2 Tax=Anaplasma phagocytophilum TaxID=948 RepID=A0A098EFS6_ANAPH|nr:Adenylyltransferase thiF [Anaplasma phagocytophilum]
MKDVGHFRNMKERYAQQVLVPEVGAQGQKRLLNSSVLVVGCGGLGSTTIPILAASGIGRLVLCDDDTVKISNLNRQTIYREEDIGLSKVDVATRFVNKLNSDVEVIGLKAAIGPRNFNTVLNDVDIVVDCVDRLAVKLFLNDACVAKNKVLIHSVAIGFVGELMVIHPGKSPCYRCFFEQQPVSTDLNCARAGVIGATVGVVGSMAAGEVIKHVIGVSQPNTGKLHRIDLLNHNFTTYEFSKNPRCMCCGTDSTTDPYDLESYEGKLKQHE